MGTIEVRYLSLELFSFIVIVAIIYIYIYVYLLLCSIETKLNRRTSFRNVKVLTIPACAFNAPFLM